MLTRPVGASLVVAEVCPRARQLGLRPGLSLGQAQAMVPGLLTLPHEPQRDRAALERLACWALRFSPTIEPVEPDTLLVDVTGCELLFGGEENIARQALEGLAQQGFRARAAIADTVGAGCALAVAGSNPIVVVPAGQASAYLAPLPPLALRIEPWVSARLEELGVRSIGDLLMLPRASLPARFGPQLVLRLQQALGEVFEGLTPFQPEQVPMARLPFEAPVADFQAISAAAEQLLIDIFEHLLRRELALRRLECVLYYEHDRLETGPPTRVFSIGLSRASRERQHVATLLSQRLQEVGWAPPASASVSGVVGNAHPTWEQINPTPGITGLMLVARETSRWHGGQGDLFEPHEAGDDEALGCLIDRLAGRLGYEAILRPQLIDDHQPELAFRHVSVAEAGCEPGELGSGVQRSGFGSSVVAPTTVGDVETRTGFITCFSGATGGLSARVSAGKSTGSKLPVAPRSSYETSSMLVPPRPVRLLPRPVPIRVIALVPDGPPTWFSYRGREYVVASAAGPERLETAWWRGPDIHRDYFRVTAETGEQFWIFHSTTEQRWYLHGVFA